MSQDRMAKTVIESGRSNSWRFITHMGDCSRRSLERNHLRHVKNSGDFESVHKEEYDGSRLKVRSRRDKFTDKLGALRRWVLSCEDMHIDDFWHAVKEKFSTAGGYTSIDHVKQHVRDFIHTGKERWALSGPGTYELLVMDEHGFLRRNKRNHEINNKAHTSFRSPL